MSLRFEGVAMRRACARCGTTSSGTAPISVVVESLTPFEFVATHGDAVPHHELNRYAPHQPATYLPETESVRVTRDILREALTLAGGALPCTDRSVLRVKTTAR